MHGATRSLRVPRAWRVGLALLATAAFAGCTSLDEFTGQNITKATSSGLAMLTGAKAPEEQNAEIEVRARSPLVVPPNYQLRPPETPEQEQAKLGNDWPEDPDIKARELAALDAAREAEAEERIRKDGVGRSRALTNEELNASMRPAGYRQKRPPEVRREQEYVLTPEELLRRHRERAKAEEAAAQTEASAAGEAGASGGTQQTQETAVSSAPSPKKKEKGFFDRLVFWE